MTPLSQCKAPQRYDGQIWYCLRWRGHDGPHRNDGIPHGAKRVWGDDRAREVNGTLEFPPHRLTDTGEGEDE